LPEIIGSTLGDAPPLVFAHRGGAAIGPENTLTAFDRGIACGADGLELDVQLSRDGAVVVLHDRTLDRTTDATGPVAALTADELARVDAAYRFDPASGFPLRGRGIGVPKLAEVLARFTGIRLIVELKVNMRLLAHRTLDEIRAAGALDRVALGSYFQPVLRLSRACEPRLPTGAASQETRLALYKSRVHWPLRRTPFQQFQVPEVSGRTRIVTPRFVRAAHAAGLPVYVWTVNREDDMRRLLSWGVDGIITDRPDVAVRVVREVCEKGNTGENGETGEGPTRGKRSNGDDTLGSLG
jgi:glycerophosphoryl diester phosphodiesterase